MPSVKSLTILSSATIEAAFRQLNANKMGVVFAVDATERVVGSVTDGDIRRYLLKDNDLATPISAVMNSAFVWADMGTAREQILKLLDHRVHCVPLLDVSGRLVEICTRSDFRADSETEVFARARAPARISFGGGGTDLTHYFVDQGGIVINGTICKYAHAALRRRPDRRIRIYSHDLRKTVEAQSLAELEPSGEGSLIGSVVRLVQPTFGFDMEVSADFPVGSGLGGSAAVAAAVIGCFNEFRSDPWDRHQISEMAFQAERLLLSIPGGWQDQYAAVFGGFNYMEFTAEHNAILPLRLEPRTVSELEESLLLCYTGRRRESGAIHEDHKSRLSQPSKNDAHSSGKQKELTLEMKRRLLRGDIVGCGRLMHDAWLLKKTFSPLVSDVELDALYDQAMANGALGGKILGAGGGGYFLFFVPPFQRYKLHTALAGQGYECERVLFEDEGLRSWKTRFVATASGQGGHRDTSCATDEAV